MSEGPLSCAVFAALLSISAKNNGTRKSFGMWLKLIIVFWPFAQVERGVPVVQFLQVLRP
ncbi:Uncharacterised protein [Yersinia enterocolitica]|nr:Uncharacterised protein [Yersinia enterocolitica]